MRKGATLQLLYVGDGAEEQLEGMQPMRQQLKLYRRACGADPGHHRLRIAAQDLVQDGIGDLIRNLVGVAHGDRLGREQLLMAHAGGSSALCDSMGE